MVKLEKSRRHKPKENLAITKTGKVTKDRKTLSKAYEKKYSHRVLENYRLDSVGRLHDKRGRFVTKQAQQKYESLKETSKEKTQKQMKQKSIPKPHHETKGHFMKRNYALTYECTCYIEEKSTTDEQENTGQTTTHYYTISSNKLLTNGQAIRRHNNNYPHHDLIHIEYVSKKVLSFD